MNQLELFPKPEGPAQLPERLFEIANICHYTLGKSITIRLGSIRQWLMCGYDELIENVPTLEDAQALAEHTASITIVSNERTSFADHAREVIRVLPESHEFHQNVKYIADKPKIRP